MDIILISLLICIVSFFLGYQFCKLRWKPETFVEITKLFTDLSNKTITPEEGRKRIEELEKKGFL